MGPYIFVNGGEDYYEEVSIQLIAPASGATTWLRKQLSSPLPVSIQLIAPASGADYTFEQMEEIDLMFPFN